MQCPPKHHPAHLDLYPLLRSISRDSSVLQPLQTPILVEEERQRRFQGGRRRISATLGQDGERVHHYTTKYVAKGVERQVVLHEVEPPYNPLRRRPHPREPKELVGEAEQCRHGAGEGAPRPDKRHGD